MTISRSELSQFEKLSFLLERDCFVCSKASPEASNTEDLILSFKYILSSELRLRDPGLKIPKEVDVVAISTCQRHRKARDEFFKKLRNRSLTVLEAIIEVIEQSN